MSYNLREFTATLKPSVVQEYLRSRGWAHAPSRGDVVAFYEKDGVVLDVPLRSDYGDFPKRMEEVILPLAEIEGCAPLALLDDLSLPVGDVLALRVQSDISRSGTLPLLDSLRYREGTKNLLLSAAHSEIAPQPYYPRLSKSEATALLSSVREGQTQRGSFVVRYVIPVEPEVGTSENETPFGRRVSIRLMKAVEEVRKVRALGSYNELLSKHREGISGNLLTALSQLRPPGDSGAIELNMGWSRNRKVPETVIKQVRMPDDVFNGLDAVAEEMRNQTQTPGFELTGYVSKLERKPTDTEADGTAVIVATGPDVAEFKTVSVKLNHKEYSKAIRAHETGGSVSVIGTLKKVGRRWTLEDASGFQVASSESDEPSSED